MDSLRTWLVASGWYILSCDPGPKVWLIDTLSPAGALWSFSGTREDVHGWDRQDSRPGVLV